MWYSGGLTLFPVTLVGPRKFPGTGNIFSQHAIENSEEKILTLLPEFGENVIYFAHELVSAQNKSSATFRCAFPFL